MLRLLLGEGLRGDATARASARDLLSALDGTVAGWLTDGFPELAPTPPAVAARLVQRALLAVVTETLATGRSDVDAAAADLAAALLAPVRAR